jgi:soluble lytic murein transglycosylase-like protein
MLSKMFKLLIMSNILLLSTSSLSYIDSQHLDSEKIAISKWIDKNSCKLKNKVDSSTLISNTYYNGKKYNIDPHLMIGLIRQESCFSYTAKSNAGAIGLTQVIPKWHKEKIKGRSLTNPNVSIEVGTMIVAEYLKSSNGDLRKALRKYSGGANNYYNKVMTNVALIKENIKNNRYVSNKILVDNKVKPIKIDTLDKWFKEYGKTDIVYSKEPFIPNIEKYNIIGMYRRNKLDELINKLQQST